MRKKEVAKRVVNNDGYLTFVVECKVKNYTCSTKYQKKKKNLCCLIKTILKLITKLYSKKNYPQRLS